MYLVVLPVTLAGEGARLAKRHANAILAVDNWLASGVRQSVSKPSQLDSISLSSLVTCVARDLQ